MNIILVDGEQTRMDDIGKSKRVSLKGLLENEEVFFYDLYNGCPSENGDKIYHKVKEINDKTDHHILWLDIYHALMNKYEKYLVSILTPKILMNLIKYNSWQAQYGLLFEYSIELSEDKKTISFSYENRPFELTEDVENKSLLDYFDTYDEYPTVEVTLSIDEVKEQYTKHHIFDNLGMFKSLYFTGKLGDYQHIIKDTILNEKQKIRALIFTYEMMNNFSDFQGKSNIPMDMIKKKLNKKGRNQNFERFIIISKKAKVDYVSEDKNGNYYYPLIGNMFYHILMLDADLKENNNLFTLLSKAEKEDKKLNKKSFYITEDMQAKIEYEGMISTDVWHYVISIYAKLYNSEYDNMKDLVKFLQYANPTNYSSSYKEELKFCPSEIFPINNFTTEVI